MPLQNDSNRKVQSISRATAAGRGRFILSLLDLITLALAFLGVAGIAGNGTTFASSLSILITGKMFASGILIFGGLLLFSEMEIASDFRMLEEKKTWEKRSSVLKIFANYSAVLGCGLMIANLDGFLPKTGFLAFPPLIPLFFFICFGLKMLFNFIDGVNYRRRYKVLQCDAKCDQRKITGTKVNYVSSFVKVGLFVILASGVFFGLVLPSIGFIAAPIAAGFLVGGAITCVVLGGVSVFNQVKSTNHISENSEDLLTY